MDFELLSSDKIFEALPVTSVVSLSLSGSLSDVSLAKIEVSGSTLLAFPSRVRERSVRLVLPSSTDFRCDEPTGLAA